MHLKKFFSAAALLGCLTMIFTGCSQKSSGLTPVTLSEVAHSIFYAPMYVAIENGYFADEGLDITLVNGSGADNVMTSLISGDADIALWAWRPLSMSITKGHRTMLSILPS